MNIMHVLIMMARIPRTKNMPSIQATFLLQQPFLFLGESKVSDG